MTRDIDWGIPIPLDGWRDNPTKRLYVWFDAVIGYLSASMEWARRSGDPGAWREWWNDPDALSYYFMGKDNIVFHSLIWPSELLAQNGEGSRGGSRASSACSTCPPRSCQLGVPHDGGQEVLLLPRVGIYVRDMLSRYSPDALRYFIIAAGPENHDTDFTLSEFVRRNNDELVDGWGNLVNRTVSMIAKNLGEIPPPGRPTPIDAALLATTSRRVRRGRRAHRAHRQKAAISEAMRLVDRGQQVPVRHRRRGSSRARTTRPAGHGAARCAAGGRRLNRMLAPFLPLSAKAVHRAARRHGRRSSPHAADRAGATTWTAARAATRSSPATTAPGAGSGADRAGRARAAPTPVFTKLDPSVVDEELARLRANPRERCTP